ncbi:nuclear transport factor 2 family protein [Sphingobacterium paludis]|uniref:Ketosteroid isomerase-like protein n=1 Tax=Sphingobacterium paludis TaxID=1476465 RepID=A0A4R7CWQ3_9SPHI|nr:nuclear transport factor 2 family protein [Sphingobacterium paludis]TDS12943.1 ketosteroid isomerase-like protein [Sphingobacterium paludis]
MQTNKDLLIRANEAVAAGRYEEFLSYCDEESIWTFVGDEILEGKDLIRSYMEKTYIEPPVFDVDELIAEGDYVTAVGKITLTDAHKNRTVYDYCDVWQVKQGKLFALKAFVIERT